MICFLVPDWYGPQACKTSGHIPPSPREGGLFCVARNSLWLFGRLYPRTKIKSQVWTCLSLSDRLEKRFLSLLEKIFPPLPHRQRGAVKSKHGWMDTSPQAMTSRKQKGTARARQGIGVGRGWLPFKIITENVLSSHVESPIQGGGI